MKVIICWISIYHINHWILAVHCKTPRDALIRDEQNDWLRENAFKTCTHGNYNLLQNGASSVVFFFCRVTSLALTTPVMSVKLAMAVAGLQQRCLAVTSCWNRFTGSTIRLRCQSCCGRWIPSVQPASPRLVSILTRFHVVFNVQLVENWR